MKRIVYILLLAIIIPTTIVGQDDNVGSSRISLGSSVYSQYLHNGLMINPAYAGSREALSAMVSYRTQWLGMDGAPVTQSLSLHSPLKKEKVALGLKAQFMQYGATKESSIYAVYAYHLRLNKGKLSFGLSGGVDVSNTNYGVLQGITMPDPVFLNNDKAYVLPNISAGVYYYNKKFFAGLSVPMFLAYNNAGNGEVELSQGFDQVSLTVTAGALFKLSDNIKVKPSTLAEYSMLNKLNKLDLNVNVIIADLVWVGASWRTTEEVAVGLLQVNVTPQLMLGFSYDYPVGQMSKASKGSTEFSLRYEFGSKVSAANPRYF